MGCQALTWNLEGLFLLLIHQISLPLLPHPLEGVLSFILKVPRGVIVVLAYHIFEPIRHLCLRYVEERANSRSADLLHRNRQLEAFGYLVLEFNPVIRLLGLLTVRIVIVAPGDTAAELKSVEIH